MDINDLILKHRVIKESYKPGIKLYKQWCEKKKEAESIDSLIQYLFLSLTESGVKVSTWEYRLASVKRYLFVTHGIDVGLSEKFQEAVLYMRKEYKTVERKTQMKIEGAPLVKKDILMQRVSKLSVRAKAVCLVNIDTANRPSDMVTLKVKDFDFENKRVNVYMKKERRYHVKDLNNETVKAIQKYIKQYNLQANDYFVGRLAKGDIFHSEEITPTGYAKAMKKWLGVTTSTVRKAKFSDMHERGADLPTIKKQTGVYCMQTLLERHLTVSDQTVSKYM